MLQQLCARRSLCSWLTFQNNSGDRVHSRKKEVQSDWCSTHPLLFPFTPFVYHDSFRQTGCRASIMVGGCCLVRINIGNTYDMNQDNQDPAVVKERVKWIKDKGPQRNGFSSVAPVTRGDQYGSFVKRKQKMCSFVCRTIFSKLVKRVFGLQYKWKMRENDCEWCVPQKREIVRNSSSSWFSPRPAGFGHVRLPVTWGQSVFASECGV